VDRSEPMLDQTAVAIAPMPARSAAAQKLRGGGASAAADGSDDHGYAPSADSADIERTPRPAKTRKRGPISLGQGDGGADLGRPAKVPKLGMAGDAEVSDTALETQVVVPQLEEASHMGTPAMTAKVAAAAVPPPDAPLMGSEAESGEVEDGESAEPCVVCLEPLGSSASSRYSLGSCGHTFHIGCILQAFRRSRGARCPLCRGTGDRHGSSLAIPSVLPEDNIAEQHVPVAAAAAAASSAIDRPMPVAHFRLISEAPTAAENEFLGVSSSDFRSLDATMLSLGRTDIACSASSTSAPGRFVCGRSELVGKVPRSLTILMRTSGSYGATRHPIVRFVNREVFLFEVLEPPPGAHDQLATAAVSGLTAKGLHVRSGKQGVWRWYPEGKRIELAQGDCISFVLEAPIDSDQAAAAKDFSVAEATCLLGLALVSFETIAME